MSISPHPPPSLASTRSLLRIPERDPISVGALLGLACLLLLAALGLRAWIGDGGLRVCAAIVALLALGMALWEFRRGRRRAWLWARLGSMALILLGFFQEAEPLGGYERIWLYGVPPVVCFLFGHREGTAWSSLVLVGWLVLAFGPALQGMELHSPAPFVARFSFSYVIISLLAFEVEWRRLGYRRHLGRETEALRRALGDVQVLQGFVPICAACKSVRDDRGYWSEIGAYLEEHSLAQVREAVCGKCRAATQRGPAASTISTVSTEPTEAPSREVERPSPVGRRWVHESVLEHRRRYLRTCLGGTAVVGLVFGLVDLVHGNWLPGSVEVGTAIVLALVMWALRKMESPAPAIHFFGIFIIVFLLGQLEEGAAGGHAFLWILAMPQMFFSIFGTRIGRLYTAILLVFGALVYQVFGRDLYALAVVHRFLAVYGLVAIVGFFLELSRETVSGRLEAESRKLAEALDHARTLRGLLPLCPSCHEVKDSAGFRTQVESYLSEQVGTRWSHGLCPTCAEEAMHELQQELCEPVASGVQSPPSSPAPSSPASSSPSSNRPSR